MRTRAAVLRPIAGEPVALVAREFGVPVCTLERWRERAAAAPEAALTERAAERGGRAWRPRAGCRARHGERTAARADRAVPRPPGPAEVAVIAGSVPPATGRAGGVARVCAVWGVPRASRDPAAQDPASAPPKARRGSRRSLQWTIRLQAA